MPKRTHRNPDHVKRHNQPSPNNEAIASQLETLLTAAIFAQQGYYRQLGLRDRILNLSLMVAAVLTLLWRQVPGVQELTRLLAREDLLWCPCTKVSQQALSERFLTFPAELFERVFKDLLPQLQQNWLQRSKRPLPDSIKFARKHFERIWVVDGSTLEALFRKLKSLEDVPKGQLAGKICTVIDIVTRLPVEVWFHTNPQANDTNFEADLLKLLTAKTLLLLDSLRVVAVFSKRRRVPQRVFTIFSFSLNLSVRKLILLLGSRPGLLLKLCRSSPTNTA